MQDIRSCLGQQLMCHVFKWCLYNNTPPSLKLCCAFKFLFFFWTQLETKLSVLYMTLFYDGCIVAQNDLVITIATTTAIRETLLLFDYIFLLLLLQFHFAMYFFCSIFCCFSFSISCHSLIHQHISLCKWLCVVCVCVCVGIVCLFYLH